LILRRRCEKQRAPTEKDFTEGGGEKIPKRKGEKNDQAEKQEKRP